MSGRVALASLVDHKLNRLAEELGKSQRLPVRMLNKNVVSVRLSKKAKICAKLKFNLCLKSRPKNGGGSFMPSNLSHIFFILLASQLF